jgi:hypothetical protein
MVLFSEGNPRETVTIAVSNYHGFTKYHESYCGWSFGEFVEQGHVLPLVIFFLGQRMNCKYVSLCKIFRLQLILNL